MPYTCEKGSHLLRWGKSNHSVAVPIRLILVMERFDFFMKRFSVRHGADACLTALFCGLTAALPKPIAVFLASHQQCGYPTVSVRLPYLPKQKVVNSAMTNASSREIYLVHREYVLRIIVWYEFQRRELSFAYFIGRH